MALKLDHISLMVRSLETSMPYYNKLLGLIGFDKLREDVWSDGQFVFQFKQANEDTRPYERYGTGMNHLGFSAPSADFVQEIQSKMRDAGFAAPEIQNLEGAVMLFMKDPDGIRFEITYYPPGVSVVD